MIGSRIQRNGTTNSKSSTTNSEKEVGQRQFRSSKLRRADMDEILVQLLGPAAIPQLSALHIDSVGEFAWRPARDLIEADWPQPVSDLLKARASALLIDRLGLSLADAAEALDSYRVDA